MAIEFGQIFLDILANVTWISTNNRQTLLMNSIDKYLGLFSLAHQSNKVLL
jgi:hypothetical protein